MIQQTLKILSELIAFDTTSRNSNLALISYIQAKLETHEIPYELTFNQDQSKANLFATIGDDSQPGIVFSGHTDVVPVDGQKWSSDPFTLREQDGKAFGRGSCDMKGFIAVCLAMIATFKSEKLAVPIHFAFSYDEEIGCLGVRDLIAALEQRKNKPLACIIGEPSNMQIVGAHKGIYHAACRITGCAGHSSLPAQGVNAIFVATDLIQRLQVIKDRLANDGPFDARFTPPYSTVHVGTIKGGTSLNIIPQHCEFEYEIRNIPAHDPVAISDEVQDMANKTLLPEMQKVSNRSAIEWHSSYAPSLDTPEGKAIYGWVDAVLEKAQQEPQPRPSKVSAVSYATEAGLFSEIGIETIVCGPGSIEQAHRPDEFIEISQLEACLEFMQAVVLQLRLGLWDEETSA